MFSCVSCHLRSGLGSFEGGVLTPPTNGNVLYKPWNSARETAKLRKGTMEGSTKLWTRSWYYLSRFGEFPNRPAYTDETLADAILEGADPEGRKFLGVMPRYPLGERDMAILIAYLKSLSKDPSPGVTETTIRFATVVTEEVSGAERDAMLGPLERFLRSYNGRRAARGGQTERSGGRGGGARIAADPDLRQMSLARWELKGSPETWRGQLEEYYRKEPVFALLGGITTKEWRPVHEFSEDARGPLPLPDHRSSRRLGERLVHALLLQGVLPGGGDGRAAPRENGGPGSGKNRRPGLPRYAGRKSLRLRFPGCLERIRPWPPGGQGRFRPERRRPGKFSSRRPARGGAPFSSSGRGRRRWRRWMRRRARTAAFRRSTCRRAFSRAGS